MAATLDPTTASLQKASKNWKAFDWTGKAGQWETALESTKEAREAAQVARKQLAEHTKQFKKSVKNIEQAGATLGENEEITAKAIEQLAKLARVTVKAYQEEIDNLTRRSKQTETAFTSLTSALSSVPDPASLLASSMEQIATQQQQLEDLAKENEKLQNQVKMQQQQQHQQQQSQASLSSAAAGFSSAKEEELIQLRREVAEYEVEFRSLKNQDITIRKLEARITELQQGGQTEFQERLEAAKQELIETEGRRTAEALEREAAMERQVASLTLQLKAERAGRAATQVHMLEASEGEGEREAAWEAQRRILVDDAERVRVSLHEATRERDELRLKLAALDGTIDGERSSLGAAPPSGGIAMADLLSERKAYEAEVAELSSTISALREEMAVKDSGVDNERRTTKLRVDTLEREIRKLNTDLAEMAVQLEAAPSQSLMDSMKRELRILKRLAYNADDTDMPETDPEIAGRNEDEEDNLESVLVAKLRRVESELVRERNNVSQVKAESDALQEAMKELQKSKAEAEETIATLEKDLDRAISSSTSSSPPKSTQRKSSNNAPPIAPSDPAALQSVLDPDAPSPTVSKLSASESTSSMAKTTSAAEAAADAHSVATIIMAQRDRLRARCEALEAERDSFKRELQAQVDAAESLKTDNTKLFEKMRYLQSFNSSNASGSRGGAYARSNSRDLDLEALEQRYEASVDPFRQFGKSERQRKLKEMSPMERMVFIVAKTMLGTKEMRTFLFFYVCALHLLVFLTTYHWSHTEDVHDCVLHHEQLSNLPPVDSRAAVAEGAKVVTG